MMKTRTEKDFLGEKELPEAALYGIHTARALDNFPIAGPAVPASLIAALAQVKKACALTNKELGLLDESKAAAILSACDQIGELPCPLPALQGRRFGS